MNKFVHPIELEFATAEEAAAHDSWFRAKVQTSLDDQRPGTPHSRVMTAARKIIEAKHRVSDPVSGRGRALGEGDSSE